MKVEIKNLTGDKLDLEVEPSYLVSELKEEVGKLQGHDPSILKLVHQGRIMEDSKSLENYDIAEGARIVVMVSKPKPEAR